jgi:hypothetical protein
MGTKLQLAFARVETSSKSKMPAQKLKYVARIWEDLQAAAKSIEIY